MDDALHNEIFMWPGTGSKELLVSVRSFLNTKLSRNLDIQGNQLYYMPDLAETSDEEKVLLAWINWANKV